MDLLVFGYLVLFYFAFSHACQKYEESTRWLQGRLKLSPKRSFFDFAWRLQLSVLLTHSPFQGRKTAMAMLEKKTWPDRYSLFFLCIASLSSLFWILISSAVFKLSGAFLFFFGALGFVARRRWPSVSAFFWMLFFVGLFLQALELSLRAGNFLVNDPQFQNLVFALADNRWPAIMICFALSIAATFVLRLEAWSLVLALFGLSLGILGLNNAVALILGESLGWIFVLLWKSRQKPQRLQKILKEMLLVTGLSVVVFFFVFGWARTELMFYQLTSFGNVSERVSLFLATFFGWVVFQTLILSIWGHFRAPKAKKA